MKRILLLAGKKLPVTYIKVLQDLGASPQVAEGEITADGFDGLVLCGGGDPDPMLYGQANRGSYGIEPMRDRQELACIHSFLKAQKPILGICRGMQILNIAFGGTLTQHLPTAQLHQGVGEEVWHDLRTEGYLRKLYGRKFSANSSHHQGIDRLGRGLRPAAWAPDGVVEAFWHERTAVLGVQFHPERMENGEKIVDLFLKSC